MIMMERGKKKVQGLRKSADKESPTGAARTCKIKKNCTMSGSIPIFSFSKIISSFFKEIRDQCRPENFIQIP